MVYLFLFDCYVAIRLLFSVVGFGFGLRVLLVVWLITLCLLLF